MNNLNITITGQRSKTIEKEIDLSNFSDLDEIKEHFAEELDASDSEEVDEIQIEVQDWQEIPKEYQDLKTVWEYVEACNEHDQEIVDAAIYCGVGLDDIDDAYSGEFDSDEDFAREQADQMGAMNVTDNWPYNCIDWEFAAKELMYDYSEHNGHYFRNL